MSIGDYLTITGLLVTISLALYNTKQLSNLQAAKAIADHYENTLSVLRQAIENIYQIEPTSTLKMKGPSPQIFIDYCSNIDGWIIKLIGIVQSVSPHLPRDSEKKLEALCKSASDAVSSTVSEIVDGGSDAERIQAILRHSNRYQILKEDCIKILQVEMRRIISQQQQHKFSPNNKKTISP